MTRQLSPADIEFIHDVLVGAIMPFDEHVSSEEYRNHALIESAAARPFQTAFGEEAWPTLPAKAAALFHSLVCNHCFQNGNKRTAVIGLDIFLGLNNRILLLGQQEVYELARQTAQANQNGRALMTVLEELAALIALQTEDMKQTVNKQGQTFAALTEGNLRRLAMVPDQAETE